MKTEAVVLMTALLAHTTTVVVPATMIERGGLESTKAGQLAVEVTKTVGRTSLASTMTDKAIALAMTDRAAVLTKTGARSDDTRMTAIVGTIVVMTGLDPTTTGAEEAAIEPITRIAPTLTPECPWTKHTRAPGRKELVTNSKTRASASMEISAVLFILDCWVIGFVAKFMPRCSRILESVHGNWRCMSNHVAPPALRNLAAFFIY